MSRAMHDRVTRWNFRVYVWGFPALSWMVLRDLQTIDGIGYWAYFWPVWLLAAGITLCAPRVAREVVK